MGNTMSEVEEYIKDVVGVVEATSFERSCLWERNKDRREWKDRLLGYSVHAGKDADRPVVFSISSAIIDGNKILFIEPTSMLVDWKMIEEWLKTNLPKSAFRGEYVNKVDAMNFHNVFPR